MLEVRTTISKNIDIKYSMIGILWCNKQRFISYFNIPVIFKGQAKTHLCRLYKYRLQQTNNYI